MAKVPCALMFGVRETFLNPQCQTVFCHDLRLASGCLLSETAPAETAEIVEVHCGSAFLRNITRSSSSQQRLPPRDPVVMNTEAIRATWRVRPEGHQSDWSLLESKRDLDGSVVYLDTAGMPGPACGGSCHQSFPLCRADGARFFTVTGVQEWRARQREVLDDQARHSIRSVALRATTSVRPAMYG